MTGFTQRRHLRAREVLDHHLATEECQGLDRAVILNLGWTRIDTTVLLACEAWSPRPQETMEAPPLDADPAPDLDPIVRLLTDHIRPGEMTDFVLTGPRAAEPATNEVLGEHLGRDRVFVYPGPGALPTPAIDATPDGPTPDGPGSDHADDSVPHPFGVPAEPYRPTFKDPRRRRRRRRRWRHRRSA